MQGSRLYTHKNVFMVDYNKNKRFKVNRMYKILIVEDNEKIRNELSDLLKRYGYESIVVTQFENVIDQIKDA